MNTQLIWAPGLIGFMVGAALYGVGVGQFVFYMQSFPRDKVRLKSLVFVVFVLDSVQTFALISIYHYFLIDCRSNFSPACVFHLPALLILSMGIIYWVTFIVQSFYAHRVWIISGGNRIITSLVFVFALAQLVLGLLCAASVIRTPTYQVLLTLKFPPLAAIASAICDAIITASVAYYLRPARIGPNRRVNYIKKLNLVFVQMGLLSFINAAAVAILYFIQDHGESKLLIAAPGGILCKTYVNSMLSVLNARKPIREEQEADAQRTIQIPTISTIL